jgi:putative sterol carrier protein
MSEDLSATDPEQLKELLGAISTPDELRQLLDAPGVNDELINDFVAQTGVDATLGRLFGLMGSRFMPDKADGKSGTVQWNIVTPDGPKSFHVVIGDGKAEGADGPAAAAKTTLTMSLPNLLRLCAGKLNGVTGVMTGKIKISGDMMFAAAMQSWFDY